MTKLVDVSVQFNFSAEQKNVLVSVLSQYPDCYQDILRIKERIDVDGPTNLTRCQAMILAGVVEQYYPGMKLTERIGSTAWLASK